MFRGGEVEGCWLKKIGGEVKKKKSCHRGGMGLSNERPWNQSCDMRVNKKTKNAYDGAKTKTHIQRDIVTLRLNLPIQ